MLTLGGQDELNRVLGTFFPHPIRFRQIWYKPQTFRIFCFINLLLGGFGLVSITLPSTNCFDRLEIFDITQRARAIETARFGSRLIFVFFVNAWLFAAPLTQTGFNRKRHEATKVPRELLTRTGLKCDRSFSHEYY